MGRRSVATFSAANDGSAAHCIYNVKSVNAPGAADLSRRSLNDPCVRQFGRTDDQDGAAAVWLIRVTNSAAAACSVVTSPRSTLPPSFVPDGGDNLSQCDDGRRVKMRGSIWRNEFRDLLAPFGFSSPPFWVGLGPSADQDFYDDDDDLFVRGRPGDRAVTITMTTAAATNERTNGSGLPTQIERSEKSWGQSPRAAPPSIHPSNPVSQPASRQGSLPPILMRLSHKNGP